MLLFEPGTFEVVPRKSRDVAKIGWAGPGVALGGTATGAFMADACATGLALPASGLGLTVAGAVLWLTGLPRERRDRVAASDRA